MKWQVFKLEITMGNSEMLTNEDIARALNEVQRKLRGEYNDNGVIRDLNGNRVGEYGFITRSDRKRY